VAHFRAIRDTRGRIVVVMTHNTDVSNSWEREAKDRLAIHRQGAQVIVGLDRLFRSDQNAAEWAAAVVTL